MDLKEIYEKYGDVSLSFINYHKYVFNFYGKTEDNKEIYCYIGGFSEDIYNLFIESKTQYSINILKPNNFNISKDGNSINLWVE